MTYKKWHEKEIKILRKLYPRPNVSVEDICRILNRSYRSVISKVNELGLHREVPPQINIRLLREVLKNEKLPVKVEEVSVVED
jgi:SNF2 family DNA or RNA helicase